MDVKKFITKREQENMKKDVKLLCFCYKILMNLV